MSGRWYAHVDAQPWTNSRRLFLTAMGRKADGRSQRFAVKPMELTPLVEGETYDVPTLSESREEAEDRIGDVTGFLQAVVDAAWASGVRPSGLADQTNEIAAVRYHLEDMRTLVKLPARQAK